MNPWRDKKAAEPTEIPSRGRFEPDPSRRQPLTRIKADPATVRLLLDRSAESASSDEPTQDYLVLEHGPGTICFAVTDGVGSSFLGNLAAKALARSMVSWLSRRPAPSSELALRDELTAFLGDLAVAVNPSIAKYPIPEQLAALVRDVLAEKRGYGSEAMFVCGRIDWPERGPAQVALAWLGDAHLLVLFEDGRELDLTGRTSDRWSTKVGPRGRVETMMLPAAQVERVIACSDGLLDGLNAAVELSDAELEARLAELAARATSDDMALIDIALVASAMPPVEGQVNGSSVTRRPELPPPVEKKVEKAAEDASVGPEPPLWRHSGGELSWTHVRDADGYGIQLAEDSGFDDPIDYHVLAETTFTLPDLPAQLRWVRMRALADGSTGPWGQGRELDQSPHGDADRVERRRSDAEPKWSHPQSPPPPPPPPRQPERAPARRPQAIEVRYDPHSRILHLRWSAVPEATSYRVRLVDALHRSMGLITTRCEARFQVRPRARYSIQVRPQGKGWTGEWAHTEVRIDRR